jgi:hypothetical protein
MKCYDVYKENAERVKIQKKFGERAKYKMILYRRQVWKSVEWYNIQIFCHNIIF